MISVSNLKAYALRAFFDLIGRLGSSVLNIGLARDLDVFTDLSYGTDAKQRLDIFRPKSADRGALPILAYFHGGGWISADKRIYKGIASTFSRNGFLTCNVNYRLAPKFRFSAPLEDAARAMDWIHQNAEQYGGDGSVIVLAGDSAGAQIAAWYASALYDEGLLRQIWPGSVVGKESLKGLLLFYGVYDFDTVLNAPFPFIKLYARSFLGSDSQEYARNSKLASPINRVSPRLPPIWLCAGESDGLFTQSSAYADALAEAGASYRTMFFSDEFRAMHGFLFLRWLRSSRAAVTAALDFLRSDAKVDF